ncbi:MAG: hypothetical protein ACK4K9_05490 [Bacteroidia bacterium]
MLVTIFLVFTGLSLSVSVLIGVFAYFNNLFAKVKECPHCHSHSHSIVVKGKFRYTKCNYCNYPNLNNEYESKIDKLSAYLKLQDSRRSIIAFNTNPVVGNKNPKLRINNLPNKTQLIDFKGNENLAK